MYAAVPAAFSPFTCLPTEEDRLLSTLSSEEMDEKFALDHQARSFRRFTTNSAEFLSEKTTAVGVGGHIQIPP